MRSRPVASGRKAAVSGRNVSQSVYEPETPQPHSQAAIRRIRCCGRRVCRGVLSACGLREVWIRGRGSADGTDGETSPVRLHGTVVPATVVPDVCERAREIAEELRERARAAEAEADS